MTRTDASQAAFLASTGQSITDMFGSVSDSMLTLLQLMTLEDFVQVISLCLVFTLLCD